MHKHTALNWITAGAVTVLAGLVYHLDEPISKSIEQASLSDAQRSAQAEARRERAATQLCVKLHGPGVAHQWAEDGSLICRARRGSGQTMVAGGEL